MPRGKKTETVGDFLLYTAITGAMLSVIGNMRPSHSEILQAKMLRRLEEIQLEVAELTVIREFLVNFKREEPPCLA